MRTRRSSRRGANALEFALILPVLVGLLFGLIEFSWYFNRYMVVSAAARDAARRAAMTPADEDPQPVAEAVALAYLDSLDTTTDVEIETTVLGLAPFRTVRVTVSRPYTAIAGDYVPAPDILSATFSLRMEEQL